MEEWKGGRVEEWKSGKVEGWKSGIVEKWKGEKMKKCVFLMVAEVAAGAFAVHRPEFVLPDVIPAAPGLECNIYFCAVLDSVRPQNYAFEARSNVGRCENWRWTWTPKEEDAGKAEQVVLNAWSDSGLACCRTVTVEVATGKADPSRRITCALLAASTTNSRFQDRILAVMHEKGWAGYTPVGSRSGSSAAKIGVKNPGEAPHDGYGGFAADDFLLRYQMSIEEIDNFQSEEERAQLKSFGVKLDPGVEWRRWLMKSPLLRLEGVKKVVDVQAWFDRIDEGRAPDYIFISLGANGTCAADSENIAAYCDRWQVLYQRDLVKHLRAAAPKAKICIATCIVGAADQDAFKGYGCKVTAVQCHKNMNYLNRRWMALVKEFNDAGDSNVFLVPAGHSVDPVNAFPVHEVKPFVHASGTVKRQCNALHSTLEGGKQLGDAFAAWLLRDLGKTADTTAK